MRRENSSLENPLNSMMYGFNRESRGHSGGIRNKSKGVSDISGWPCRCGETTWRCKVLTLLALSFLTFCSYFISSNWMAMLKYTRVMVCASPETPGSRATTEGRLHNDFPSPRCCVDEDCLEKDRGRYAVLTTLRSNDYLPLLHHLACSLKNSNPGVTLLVATVKGDLSEEIIKQVQGIKNVKLMYWEEFRFENTLRQRFALNWVKLRAWEMDEYDMILMIDTDTLVLGNINHLWKIPAHFATVLDQDKDAARFNALGRQQGGVVLLRPCKAVAKHMMHLVRTNMTLQFAPYHAEQSFLDWYFRYDRWTLPIKYNAIGHKLVQMGDFTSGGTKPVIVHYTKVKQLELDPEKHHEQALAASNC